MEKIPVFYIILIAMTFMIIFSGCIGNNGYESDVKNNTPIDTTQNNLHIKNNENTENYSNGIKWIMKDVDVNASLEELEEIKNSGFDIIGVEWGVEVGEENAKKFLEKAKKANLSVIMDAGFSQSFWRISDEGELILKEDKLREWVNSLKNYSNIYAWDICNEYGANFEDNEEGENQFPIYLNDLKEVKKVLEKLDPKRRILVRMHDWDYEEMDFDLRNRYEKGLADIFMLNMYSNWVGEGKNDELIKETKKYIAKIKEIDPNVEIWIAIASFEELPYFKRPNAERLKEEIGYLKKIKEVRGIGFYGFGKKGGWYLPNDKELWNTIKEEIIGVKGEIPEINNESKIINATNIKTNKKWHYQLQNAKFDELKRLDVDYVVVDIDDAKLTKKEIKELNNKGIKVISYLSIGEAEDYRDYWKDYWEVGHPNYIVEENPEWKGNYKVEYWNREWQRIVFNQLDRIIESGYNGVYLDIIDAYEYFEDRKDVDARKEMIEFVKRISELAKNKNKEFLIIPQNGVDLYKEEDYANAIDGVGKEDTWYDEHGELEKEGLDYLKKVKEDGKIVLVVDYPIKNEYICDFYEKCWAEGFYCVVENRELNANKPTECK